MHIDLDLETSKFASISLCHFHYVEFSFSNKPLIIQKINTTWD